MQRYADHLIRFSQAQATEDDTISRSGLANGVALGTPSRPLQSMGAYDTFGGAIAGDNTVHSDNGSGTPRRVLPAIAAEHNYRESSQCDRDAESNTSYETETDAETDDEPTIRPAHSCSSSDTQSLFSNDASEASESADDQGDDLNDDDDDDEGSATDEERPPVAGQAPPQRWSRSRSASIDVDKHMASP